ncbi:meiotic recombination [Bulinus truncatus]|nr:meiotic recombination [Bulinus truncatus]
MASEDHVNTFKILVASDIHLGFMESDPIRGNDSLNTFEEILQVAREKNVDFILHGGDLFHDNKPSRSTLHGCLALLREYCMGDKPVHFEYLSDQSIDFKHCKFPNVNYEEPNFNISIPVFSIHGNHDDPTGPGNLCSLDLLHTAGFVNYFGKATLLDKIQVSPLLLQKGETKLALYGLGSVRDERLHRMFLKKDVSMLRPKEHPDKWFNMFVLHQNRAKHSATSYVPEQFLEDFLDLVVWGHEHECRLNVTGEKVEWNPTQNFYVCQPGSSIATSLSEGETVSKHVGLLEINGKNFRMQSVQLKSVRQFYMEDVVLGKHIKPTDPNAQKKAEIFCLEKVEELLLKAENEHTGSVKQPRQPLVRLRVDYSGFDPFSSQRFGQKFVDKIANPKTMINFHRQRIERSTFKEDPEVITRLKQIPLDSARVEDMVSKIVSEDGYQLKLLTEKGMGEAVKEYVEKDEKGAIGELVKYQLKKTQGYLQKRNTSEDQIVDDVVRFKEERKKTSGEIEEEVKTAIKEAQAKRESQPNNDNDDWKMASDDDDDVESENKLNNSKNVRGRGTRGRGRDRGTDFDEKLDSKSNKRGRGSRGGRGSRASKAPVASERGNIKSFLHPSTSSSRLSLKSSEEESIILDDSDEDNWSNYSRSSVQKSKTPTKKRKINYTDDSEEEENMKKRKK